jgi:hypothetical protein
MVGMNAVAPTILILCLVAALYAFYHSKQMIDANPFLDKNLTKRGLEKPPLWLYYDTSDVNSRWWYDFGARSSRALNLPFLNLCYDTIVSQNSEHYRIEVITGLTGVAALLGGPQALPSGLQNPLTTVNEAHLNWIRAAILARYGGLWVSPYTICLQPFKPLVVEGQQTQIITFYGTDLEETYAGKEGTALPGFRCIACPQPTPQTPNQFFIEWEQLCRNRLDHIKGGQEIRGDAKWDWVALTAKYPGVEVDFAAECGRKKGGRRIELEDLLATGTEGNLPFPVLPCAVYVPISWPELRDRELFGWFLRMSEEQILVSDLAITYLFQKGLQVL